MADTDKTNALMAAAIRSPWSVVNLILIVVGGCGVWYTMQGEFDRLKDTVLRQQLDMADLKRKVEQNERDSNEKLVAMQRDITEVKVASSRIESALQILIRNIPPHPPPSR